VTGLCPGLRGVAPSPHVLLQSRFINSYRKNAIIPSMKSDESEEEVLIPAARTQFIDVILESFAQEGIPGRELRIDSEGFPQDIFRDRSP